jgi:hypothetical protein
VGCAGQEFSVCLRAFSFLLHVQLFRNVVMLHALCTTCEITIMYELFYFIPFYTLLPCFHLMVSINAANPVGAVSEFITQLQILELLDNVSNHAS